jgi:predicted GH43/DUF377 family glycosyl hydrolase
VAERPREQRPGYTALPRWTADDGPIVEWTANDELDVVDPRVVRRRSDGVLRLTFVSHLRVATSRDGRTIDHIGPPAFVPERPEEEFGIEDPRITLLDGRYYVTYVSVSRHGAATALASTTDFKHFERHGIIFCPENKDVVLLPERVGGDYIALHRPNPAMPFCNPAMWIARSTDLVHWGGHRPFYGGRAPWETGRVGAGAPPLALPDGWLEIYHGNRRPTAADDVGSYCGGALLADRNDPARVLRIGREPILEPSLDFEQEGFVANVVFPTGVLTENDRLLVYYGASDKYSAVAELSRDDVLNVLE